MRRGDIRRLRKHGIVPVQERRPRPERIIHNIRKQKLIDHYLYVAGEWLRNAVREGRATGYNKESTVYKLIQSKWNINSALKELGREK